MKSPHFLPCRLIEYLTGSNLLYGFRPKGSENRVQLFQGLGLRALQSELVGLSSKSNTYVNFEIGKTQIP